MDNAFTPDPFGPDIPFPFPRQRVPWKHEWLELNKLWWKRPESVRILMYMDGASFDGGSFYGLQHVIGALASDPWPWAKFIVTTANRYTDAAADQDGVTLTDLNLGSYDEVWLFGIDSNVNLLSAAEVNALEAFMDGGGGVMTTGDHASLGRGLSGSSKRISKLRMYPAPVSSPPVWNTTIRDANGDGQYLFEEQSDATPQIIRPRYYHHWSLGGAFPFLKRSPHPVLCAEQGVLKTLPDHQHEGQVVIPDSFPLAEWPKVGSYQPKPEIIAWGRILDPAATNSGQEFPVIGAYDGHRANVGRIVADSTWHHWFDINLDGFDPASDAYRDITSYYQNVAAWLAPKGKQKGMRNGVFWLALHENILIEHALHRLPYPQLVPLVRDALGRWAPQCMVSGWILELLPISIMQAVRSDDPSGLRAPVALDELILAETFAELQQHFDTQSCRPRAAEDFGPIDKALLAAAPRALARVAGQCEADIKAIHSLAAGLRSPKTPASAATKQGRAKKPKKKPAKKPKKKPTKKQQKPTKRSAH